MAAQDERGVRKMFEFKQVINLRASTKNQNGLGAQRRRNGGATAALVVTRIG